MIEFQGDWWFIVACMRFRYSRKFQKCVVCQLQNNKRFASVLSFTDFFSYGKTDTPTCELLTSICSHAPYNCMLQRALRSSQKPASRRLECTPSTALAAPERAVWCVSGSWRAALILIDPHGWHRRSPPTNQNKQTGEKHRNCQKWHNEDNESTSLTAEQANAVCGHEAQWGVEISSPDLCLKTKCVSWSNPGPDHLKMMLYEHLRFFGRLAVIGL